MLGSSNSYTTAMACATIVLALSIILMVQAYTTQGAASTYSVLRVDLSPASEPVDCSVAEGELSSDVLRPMMTDGERSLLNKYLDQAKFYFETGSGGSTYQAASKENIKKVIAVESNPVWIRVLRKNAVVHKAECMDNRLSMFYVDINSDVRNGKFSFPMDNSKKYNWAVYAGAIGLLTGSPWQPKPDTVFIDGRFRVACAIHAYKAATSDTIIMIHDYSRRAYHVVERFLERVEQVDSLAVFKRKKLSPSEEASLDALLAEYLDVHH